MADSLIGTVAFLAGGGLAWSIRGAIAARNVKTLHARVEGLASELEEERRELEAVRREHEHTSERLRSETERRARAEADRHNEGKVLVAVNDVIRPLRESLEKFDGKLDEIEQARIGAYAALDQQLQDLVETHWPALRDDVAGLVEALRQSV